MHKYMLGLIISKNQKIICKIPQEPKEKLFSSILLASQSLSSTAEVGFILGKFKLS